MAGVFTTSLFSWIAFDGGEDERYKIAIICICVISLILTVAFWFLHKSQQEYNGMIGQDIICEMDRIEEQFTSSVSDGDDIPLL